MADAGNEDERDSIEEFRQQLAWREFYAQVLYFNPNVVDDHYKDYKHEIDWNDDPDDYGRGRREKRAIRSSTRECASYARKRTSTTVSG